MAHDPIIQHIADIFDITILDFEGYNTLQVLLDSGSNIRNISCSPVMGHIDARRKLVAVPENVNVEYVFHELCHIICAPPFYDLDPKGTEDIPEYWLLMPYERELARSCNSPHLLDAVSSWQYETVVDDFYPLHRTELRDYGSTDEELFRTNLWQLGLWRARQVGLLDENNYPTFKYPNWNVIFSQHFCLNSCR